MKQISDFPRVSLAVLPTPLHKLENVSKRFGKNIYIKRDDMTGVALGGNKVRKLEFLLADAKNKGAELIMTTGQAQSNHAMLTAACANKLGMKTCLMLKKRGVTGKLGNQILNSILGAEVEFYDTDSYADIYAAMDEKTAAYAKQGKVAYGIPCGGSNALGALGYAECVRETMEQCKALGIKPDRMVSVVGSGGTYAGLCAGADLYAPDMKVTGIAVDSDPFDEICAKLKLEIGELLELDRPLGAENIEIYDNCGAGYSIPGPKDGEAVRYMARQEGIILDPVYTGKAFSKLLSMLEEGAFAEDDTIIFLHSGGAGGVFAIDLP
ncbi:MAG: D-cysteine desulfhydrase family protein [Oscillospiraceae bacterium]|nr:D-cysteine desulfhydrase family protein [Oscillospiraceae bacterium]